MIRKCYPYGKKKAFNVTYDDGVLQDVRFVELLNRYGLKGTFNLNSALMENEFEWVHEKGCVVKRLRTDVVKSLYAGHEVASHTLNHPYMHGLSKEGILWELSQDKRNLEELFGEEIKGFAVPFDYYSDLIEECVKECGFAYGRISEMSHSFRPQNDYYRWKATVFHCEDAMEGLTQQFVETDEELALFQIVGHSYDLDTENMWDRMENVFQIIAKQDAILPMTTIEIIEYLKAMEKAEITDQYIQNHSEISLWFAVNDIIYEIRPTERVAL
ncbi:polysaccharide deacetylase family protein [Anaerotignum sp.]